MPFPRRPRTAAAVLAALASAGVLAAQVLAVPPAADFTVTPGVPDVGDPVAFDSTVTDEDAGDTFSYAWDFDDGDSSTDEDPSHTYTTSGTKTVTLTVTDDPGGETTTVTRNVRVNAPPNAAFGFRPGDPEPEPARDLHVIVERRRGRRRRSHGTRTTTVRSTTAATPTEVRAIPPAATRPSGCA